MVQVGGKGKHCGIGERVGEVDEHPHDSQHGELQVDPWLYDSINLCSSCGWVDLN